MDVGFMRPLLVWRGYWIDGENVMSGFKGTPGPWEVDRNNVHSGRIATIHHCIGNDWVEIWSPDWPDTEEKQEANARLISAAPELLEALQELVHADCHGVRNSSAQVKALNKAMLAIDKALGR
ncbi:TPA: hypothetical protein ACF54C_004942 [Serratia marcescens]